MRNRTWPTSTTAPSWYSRFSSTPLTWARISTTRKPATRPEKSRRQCHVGRRHLDHADLRRRRRGGRRRGLGPVPPESRTNHDRSDDGDRNDAPRPTRHH
jgi:hypothetical protein